MTSSKVVLRMMKSVVASGDDFTNGNRGNDVVFGGVGNDIVVVDLKTTLSTEEPVMINSMVTRVMIN